MFGPACYSFTDVQQLRGYSNTITNPPDASVDNVIDPEVASSNPLNSGDGSDGLVSPKFTAVLGPWLETEFYVNAGMGFHSNDARGATITVDPLSGEPAEPLKPLIRAKGAEFGVRTVHIKGLQSTIALWYLGFESELLFVGDSGTTEPGRQDAWP